MSNLLPNSIADEHYRALERILEERSDDYDLEQLVPLLIDNLDPSALVHLAEWFSILGVEGWNYADTDAKKRDLLKNAILIHRKKATPFSIKEALVRAGFTVKRIEEGTRNYTIPVAPFIKPKYGLKFDGTAKFNGAYSFGKGIRARSYIQFDGKFKFNGQHKFGATVNTLPNGNGQTGSRIAWALFRVVLLWNLNDDYTTETHDAVIAVIEAFKNARSWLTDVGLETSVNENISIGDDGITSNVGLTFREMVGVGFLFNGAKKFDGSFKFSAGIRDAVAMEIAMQTAETLTSTEALSGVTLGMTLQDNLEATEILTYQITP